jgi:hypothetical protein
MNSPLPFLLNTPHVMHPEPRSLGRLPCEVPAY